MQGYTLKRLLCTTVSIKLKTKGRSEKEHRNRYGRSLLACNLTLKLQLPVIVIVIVLLLSLKWHAQSLQSCPTLRPQVLYPPGLHGSLQARILEWVAIPSSRGSSWPSAPCISCLAGGFFTAEPSGSPCARLHTKSTMYVKSFNSPSYYRLLDSQTLVLRG